MMDVRFLGRGAAFYPAFGNTNAYFTIGKDLLFLDFGESAFAEAMKRLQLAEYENIYVLITHLHADHAGSLASLISYTHCVLGFCVTVVHPVDTVVELLRLQGITPSFYRHLPELPSKCGIIAEAVEVRHAADMRSFGYLLSDGEERIFYSGDAYELSPRIARELEEGKLARVYHDVSSTESNAHCYLKRLESAVSPKYRKRVYAMHLDSDCVDQLKQAGFSVVEVMEA